MATPPPRANFFDASALVKVYAPEPGSDVVRKYFYNRAPTRYTTPFCFYEALNILKAKWLYQDQWDEDQYRKAASQLIAWFGASTRHIKDIDFTKPEVFSEVQRIARRHTLDLSDAFQILSVKSGYFSHLASDSRTILVTADRQLAQVARLEGVKVWNILDEPEP